MRWCLGLFTFLLISLALPQGASADILFINMNGSATEIPAAQEAADYLGERLYVLPETSKGPPSSKYNSKLLSQDLVRLAKLGVRPRAMIVSGHHVKNQGYFGKNGEISLYRLFNLVPNDDADVHAFFASLQSLYLWGCYTGTLTHVNPLLTGYGTVFSNTKYIVGFADKAPLATVPASGQVLKDMLTRESQFRSRAPQQMWELLKQVSASYKDQYDFIVHKERTFMTKDSYSSIDDFVASCQDESSRQDLLQSVLLVWKYYWNEIGPLPVDTAKSPLREAYRNLQRNNFCIQMGVVELNQVQEIPPLSTVIRLIYYKNVIQNFARLHAPAVEFAKSELESIGLTDLEFLTQLPKIERGDAMKRLDGVHKSLKKIFPDFKSDVEQRANYLYFNAMINDIESVIYPSEEFVPQTWIDSNSSEKSRFPILNDFVKGKERMRKKALRQLEGPSDL